MAFESVLIEREVPLHILPIYTCTYVEYIVVMETVSMVTVIVDVLMVCVLTSDK